MSKGSIQRPRQVSTNEFNSNWDKAFKRVPQSESTYKTNKLKNCLRGEGNQPTKDNES